MYNNPYINSYNQQANIDRLNEQINNLEKMKAQMQQPLQQPPQQLPQQPITQNFQLAPTTRDVIRYATSLEEVQRDMVIGETPYFSKDMSVVWIKNIKGEIKTYELNEIIPKDEKDIQIEYLKDQIKELKEKIENEQFNPNVATKQNATNTTEYDEPVRKTTQNEKSTSFSKISRSKKEQ